MQRSLLHPYVFTMPRGDGPLRRSPHVELGVGSTSAAVLQQKQHVQQRSRDVQQQYVSPLMLTLLGYRICGGKTRGEKLVVAFVTQHFLSTSSHIILGFPCFFRVFTIPRHIEGRGRLLSTLPAHRSPSRWPSLALTPVLSPATPRAIVQNGAFEKTDSDVKIQSDATTTTFKSYGTIRKCGRIHRSPDGETTQNKHMHGLSRHPNCNRQSESDHTKIHRKMNAHASSLICSVVG